MYCILLYFKHIFAKPNNNKMQKILLFVAVSILSIQLNAQSKKSAQLLSEISQGNNVFSMSYAKPMEDFFDMNIDLNGKEKTLVGDFSGGKLTVISEKRDLEKILHDFKDIGFKEHDFEKEKNEKDVHLIYYKESKLIKEAHFIIQSDEEIILFSLFGDMKLVDKE